MVFRSQIGLPVLGWVVDPFLKRVVLVEGVPEWKLVLRMEFYSQNEFPF